MGTMVSSSSSSHGIVSSKEVECMCVITNYLIISLIPKADWPSPPSLPRIIFSRLFRKRRFCWYTLQICKTQGRSKRSRSWVLVPPLELNTDTDTDTHSYLRIEESSEFCCCLLVSSSFSTEVVERREQKSTWKKRKRHKQSTDKRKENNNC